MHTPPRRLLLITNKLARTGGAEGQLLHLAEALATRGYEVTVCCVDFSAVSAEEASEAGFELVELGAKRWLARALAVPHLIRLARRADVVQCTMWDPSLWGRIAAIVARRPVIVADHASDRSIQVSTSGTSRARWIALHNRLLDRYTFATIVCASLQRQVLLGEGVDAAKIVHIPNGIPIDELRRVAAESGDRGSLGLPGSGSIAMQVGFFRPEKNQMGSLEAFPQVRQLVPDAQLVFVGDGPQLEAVRRRAAELDAAGWVHFLGLRPDVPALLAKADILLLSSSSEAMPMTVLEAMALGVPTVATDVGDVRRTLADRAGICVPPNDPEALATACSELLSDPGRRDAMGAAGRELAPQFDSSTMAERYVAIFEAACIGTPPLLALERAAGALPA